MPASLKHYRNDNLFYQKQDSILPIHSKLAHLLSRVVFLHHNNKTFENNIKCSHNIYNQYWTFLLKDIYINRCSATPLPWRSLLLKPYETTHGIIPWLCIYYPKLAKGEALRYEFIDNIFKNIEFSSFQKCNILVLNSFNERCRRLHHLFHTLAYLISKKSCPFYFVKAICNVLYILFRIVTVSDFNLTLKSLITQTGKPKKLPLCLGTNYYRTIQLKEKNPNNKIKIPTRQQFKLLTKHFFLKHFPSIHNTPFTFLNTDNNFKVSPPSPLFLIPLDNLSHSIIPSNTTFYKNFNDIKKQNDDITLACHNRFIKSTTTLFNQSYISSNNNNSPLFFRSHYSAIGDNDDNTTTSLIHNPTQKILTNNTTANINHHHHHHVTRKSLQRTPTVDKSLSIQTTSSFLWYHKSIISLIFGLPSRPLIEKQQIDNQAMVIKCYKQNIPTALLYFLLHIQSLADQLSSIEATCSNCLQRIECRREQTVLSFNEDIARTFIMTTRNEVQDFRIKFFEFWNEQNYNNIPTLTLAYVSSYLWYNLFPWYKYFKILLLILDYCLYHEDNNTNNIQFEKNEQSSSTDNNMLLKIFSRGIFQRVLSLSSTFGHFILISPDPKLKKDVSIHHRFLSKPSLQSYIENVTKQCLILVDIHIQEHWIHEYLLFSLTYATDHDKNKYDHRFYLSKIYPSLLSHCCCTSILEIPKSLQTILQLVSEITYITLWIEDLKMNQHKIMSLNIDNECQDSEHNRHLKQTLIPKYKEDQKTESQHTIMNQKNKLDEQQQNILFSIDIPKYLQISQPSLPPTQDYKWSKHFIINEIPSASPLTIYSNPMSLEQQQQHDMSQIHFQHTKRYKHDNKQNFCLNKILWPTSCTTLHQISSSSSSNNFFALPSLYEVYVEALESKNTYQDYQYIMKQQLFHTCVKHFQQKRIDVDKILYDYLLIDPLLSLKSYSLQSSLWMFLHLCKHFVTLTSPTTIMTKYINSILFPKKVYSYIKNQEQVILPTSDSPIHSNRFKSNRLMMPYSSISFQNILSSYTSMIITSEDQLRLHFKQFLISELTLVENMMKRFPNGDSNHHELKKKIIYFKTLEQCLQFQYSEYDCEYKVYLQLDDQRLTNSLSLSILNNHLNIIFDLQIHMYHIRQLTNIIIFELWKQKSELKKTPCFFLIEHFLTFTTTCISDLLLQPFWNQLLQSITHHKVTHQENMTSLLFHITQKLHEMAKKICIIARPLKTFILSLKESLSSYSSYNNNYYIWEKMIWKCFVQNKQKLANHLKHYLDHHNGDFALYHLYYYVSET